MVFADSRRYGHFTPNISACGGQSGPADNAAFSAGTGEGGQCPSTAAVDCAAAPCLYDVQTDKTEHEDVAAANPAALAKLLARWSALGTGYHPPPNPNKQDAVYCAALANNRGFVAPWTPQ